MMIKQMAFRALLPLCAVAGCHSETELHAKSLTAVKVRAVAQSVDASGARYSANIEPATRVDLAFKVGGYVERVAQIRGVDGKLRILQEGDHVARTTELASVRKSDYAQKLAEAKASLAEAVAAHEQAQLDFDRTQRLTANNAVSKANVDATRVQLSAATARLDGAKVRVEEAQTMLSDTAIRAPMDGVILRRSVEVGALASPGAPAFSLADTSTVKVVFGVPDTVLEPLRLGAPQLVTSEAFRGVEFSGRITRIAPAADPKSRVFEVEVSIPNATDTQQPQLKVGMVAALKLNGAAGVVPSVAVLPLSAVVRSRAHADRFAVFALDDKSTPPLVHVREVELGDLLGNVIPVKSGLAAGEKVVVQGASLLSDGEPVRVIP